MSYHNGRRTNCEGSCCCTVAMLVGGAGTTIQPYLSKDYWQDPVGHYPEQDQGLQRLDLQTRMRDRLITVAKQQFHYPIIPVTARSSVDSPAINPRTDTPDFLLQVGVTKIGFVGSEVSEDPLLEYVIEATAILSSSSGKKIQTRYLKYKSTPHRLRSWTGAAVNPSEWDTPEPSISSPSRTISEPLERELEYSLDFLAQQILDPLLR